MTNIHNIFKNLINHKTTYNLISKDKKDMDRNSTKEEIYIAKMNE